jgi:predicted HTH domain antitoxin
MVKRMITESTVLSLFREEKITASRGAELLSIPLQDFMDLLNQNELSLDDVTAEDMVKDLNTLQKLRTKYEKKAQTL